MNPMQFSYSGKTALVTGAGSGVGAGTALEFARQGANVVLVGRSRESLDDTLASIQLEGGNAITVIADVTQERDVVAAMAAAVAQFGKVDVAFNNAGVFTLGATDELSYDEWSHTMNTNVTGVWLCLKHAILQMRLQGGGTIVNMSSNLGAHLAYPGMAAYITSKAAVSALTKAAAVEAIAHGIRINSISAGPLDTPMSVRPGESLDERANRMRAIIPLGRAGQISEVAAAVLWLAGDASGFVTGHDLVMDGAESL